ncbi:MAG: ABC transporter permease [Oscillospiraceae bacterium]|nr:ABC transporter permease [Oscillospiraceae bacterium]
MKFGSLLKKELREMLTPQVIFTMIFVCFLLMIMGQFVGSTVETVENTSEINICVRDDGEFTRNMLEKLGEYGYTVNLVDIEGEDYCAQLEEKDIKSVLIIPEGFSEAVERADGSAQVEVVTYMNGGGFMSVMEDATASDTASGIAEYISEYYRTELLDISTDTLSVIDNPLNVSEITAANGNTAQMSVASLMSTLMTESMIAPAVIMMLLMMASQTIMAGISGEKINKTLETLLSAPVSRISIICAKMAAALIVALLYTAAMAVGMIFYISSLGEMMTMGTDTGEAMDIANAMTALGITLSVGDILLFGLQIFLSIAIGLCVSLILGAMADNTASVQTLTMPVVIFVMLPFVVTVFTDISELPQLFKWIMYAIPFTHTYTAINNLTFGNMSAFWGGLAYQAIFFGLCMYLAVRVFTTDKLFTMSFAIKKGKEKTAGE